MADASIPSPPPIESLTQGRTFEETPAGFTFRTARRTVTEADLVTFVNWGGFNEPLFRDVSGAEKAGYAGRLVPGAMVYALAEGLIMQTNVLHGTGMAFMRMELSISQPVYVGDTLHAIVETTESRPASKGNRGVVTSRVSVLNQRDEEVLTYSPVRLIRGKDN
jgi:acyl dehydratase